MFIIDWEFTQFGHRAYDLGQIIGDLYERKHFKGVNGATWAIQGFIDGYGPLTNEMAFRTAIHAGVHLICWYTRRPQKGPLPASPEQVTDLLKLARDFVVKGWEKDRRWFEDTSLAHLFRRN
jgi:thiamine kinase-like enzyme